MKEIIRRLDEEIKIREDSIKINHEEYLDGELSAYKTCKVMLLESISKTEKTCLTCRHLSSKGGKCRYKIPYDGCVNYNRWEPFKESENKKVKWFRYVYVNREGDNYRKQTIITTDNNPMFACTVTLLSTSTLETASEDIATIYREFEKKDRYNNTDPLQRRID